MTNILPDKPSALIRVALTDLRRCAADPRYEIFMGTWHAPSYRVEDEPDICYVCLAGSVMAKTLGADINIYNLPSTYILAGLDRKLAAINDLREGHVLLALANLDVGTPPGNLDRSIIDYTPATVEQFHDEMNALARDLEGAML